MSKKAGTALSVMAMVFMGALASPLTVLAADAEKTYQLLCMQRSGHCFHLLLRSSLH